jgi:hypothetical protein
LSCTKGLIWDQFFNNTRLILHMFIFQSYYSEFFQSNDKSDKKCYDSLNDSAHCERSISSPIPSLERNTLYCNHRKAKNNFFGQKRDCTWVFSIWKKKTQRWLRLTEIDYTIFTIWISINAIIYKWNVLVF